MFPAQLATAKRMEELQATHTHAHAHTHMRHTHTHSQWKMTTACWQKATWHKRKRTLKQRTAAGGSCPNVPEPEGNTRKSLQNKGSFIIQKTFHFNQTFLKFLEGSLSFKILCFFFHLCAAFLLKTTQTNTHTHTQRVVVCQVCLVVSVRSPAARCQSEHTHLTLSDSS